MSLVPCPSCVRHVRSSETTCPFCKNALPVGMSARAVPASPRRLDRLAAFTFAASLAVTACGGKSTDPIGSGSDEVRGERGDGKDDKDGQPDDEGQPMPMYGMPAPALDGGAAAPMYGMPAPPDDDWGGGQPSYGMPAPQRDAGAMMPMYGMPPGDR